MKKGEQSKMKKRIISLLLSVFVLIGVLNYPAPEVQAAGGYSIRINYQTNTVNVYYNGEPYKCFLCSTGTWTPHSGTYNLGTKYRWAMLKGGVWGQYCAVITGNIWFHSVPYFSSEPPARPDVSEWQYAMLNGYTITSLQELRLHFTQARIRDLSESLRA